MHQVFLVPQITFRIHDCPHCYKKISLQGGGFEPPSVHLALVPVSTLSMSDQDSCRDKKRRLVGLMITYDFLLTKVVPPQSTKLITPSFSDWRDFHSHEHDLSYYRYLLRTLDTRLILPSISVALLELAT